MLPILLTSFALMAPIPAIDAAALKKEQEARWKELSQPDELVATRALLIFSKRPAETISFFKGVMKPLKIDEETVKKRIADLANDNEKVWKPAFEMFEYQDPRLSLTLQKCFDEAVVGPGTQRLVEVLCDVPASTFEKRMNIQLRFIKNDFYNFSSEDGSWWAEHKISRLTNNRWGTTKKHWTRAERAIVLLEHFRTKEAIELLKTMATGHAEAGPTVAAKEALLRLKAEDATALKKELDAAWKDLASREEKVASRAILKLSNHPVETVAFLKEMMKPLNIDEETVKKRIADLASKDEKVWKPAFELFQYQDPRLACPIEDCFELSTPGLGRQRLVAVLGDVEANTFINKEVELVSRGDGSFFFSGDKSTWWAEHKVSRLAESNWSGKQYWTRAKRAIVLLELIGKKEATEVLKTIATGHPEAAPTVAAKEALKRLKVE